MEVHLKSGGTFKSGGTLKSGHLVPVGRDVVEVHEIRRLSHRHLPARRFVDSRGRAIAVIVGRVSI